MDGSNALSMNDPGTSRHEYVIFTLHGSGYAIDAGCVQEIIALPALTPIAEAPEYMAGLLDVRGTVVPVIDLAVRMGMPRELYAAADNVILFHHGGHRFGIIINDVHEVRSIGPDSIDPVPAYGLGASASARFILGIARGEGGLVAVLSPASLLAAADTLMLAAGDAATSASARFLADLPAADRAILAGRADALMRRPDGDETAGHIPLALFRLGDEYFGARLDVIREFTEIVAPTPVPCAPAHIVGLMNLRGDILTLVDIRPALRMPLAARAGAGKVIVLAIPDLHAGVVADDVIDVIAIAAGSVAPPPAAVGAPVDEYIRGVARHDGRVISIIDLAAIFARGEL